MKLKTCCRCHKAQPIENFTPDKRASDKLMSSCKTCTNISARKAHANNRAKRNKRSRELGIQYRQRVSVLKIKQGCYFCGFNTHSSALEFHHLDPATKDYNIGNIARGSWEKIEKEIEKTIVVCSNCHRMLHAGVLKLEEAGCRYAEGV